MASRTVRNNIARVQGGSSTGRNLNIDHEREGAEIPTPAHTLFTAMLALAEQFGNIDIYLFDQLLRGRITPGMRILDAGCGSGRNLVYFPRSAQHERYEIFGVDSDAQSIAAVRRLAASLAPTIPAENFRHETSKKYPSLTPSPMS